MSMAPTDVTRLIHRVHGGDEAAREDLWSLVYDELRRLASGQMARERGAHTLQPTALVHEAWLRLLGHGPRDWESRAHFFGVAAEAMRRILVEHARRLGRLRRGGGLQRVHPRAAAADRTDTGAAADGCWDELLAGLETSHRLADDLAALDEALARMQATGRHDRKCEVVKLRFFAGLTNEQVAEVLDTSVSSVKRDWEFAKAWLTRALADPEAAAEGRAP
jgi:RNA polymerase sigma factor (sigma-70 family)